MGKVKTFDCVEMKRQAQKRLQQEYAARGDEFPSYTAFLDATAKESAWVQSFLARLAAERDRTETSAWRQENAKR